MRILFISDSFLPGTGRFMNIAPEKLMERGHDVELYTSNILTEPSTINASTPDYVRKFWGFRIGNKVFYPGMAFKLLFGKRPDVVHSYVMGFYSTFVSGYLKKIKGYPLVVDADVSVHQPSPKGLKKIYFQLYKKIPTSKADAILSFTEEQRRRMIDEFGFDERKVRTIPWGVDIKRFEGPAKIDMRKKYGLEGKFIVLNVAQIIRVRNFETMINAMPMIDDKDVVFVNIGSFTEEKYKKELDELIERLGMQDRFKFLGQMKFEDVIEFYKAADAYLQMAKSEGFCNPLLESAAAGLPIVSTNVGVARDMIKDKENGFIVSTDSEVAERIKLLRKDGALRMTMGQKIREAVKPYDWEIIIDKLESIYKELAAKR